MELWRGTGRRLAVEVGERAQIARRIVEPRFFQRAVGEGSGGQPGERVKDALRRVPVLIRHAGLVAVAVVGISADSYLIYGAKYDALLISTFKCGLVTASAVPSFIKFTSRIYFFPFSP